MRQINKTELVNKFTENLKNRGYKLFSDGLKDPEKDDTFSVEGVLLETLRKDFGIGNWRGKTFQFDQNHTINAYLTFKDFKDISPNFTKDEYYLLDRMKKNGTPFPVVSQKVKQVFRKNE